MFRKIKEIRYFYKLTIATQRVMSKVQTLTVPLRVLPIPLIARTDEMPITEETNDELAPTNPFLEKKDLTELEISWHHLKVCLYTACNVLILTSFSFVECYSSSRA